MDHDYLHRGFITNKRDSNDKCFIISQQDAALKHQDERKDNLTNPPPSTSRLIEAALPDGNIVEIQIHNMLCNYTLPMHIDLRLVAYRSANVDYDRARGVLIKQLRNPLCTVKIYNSGKVVIVRCKSEEECKRAARTVGRMLQRSMDKLKQRICIRSYRVSNILATCRMPFAIRIEDLARKYRGEGAKYEPELMVGLEWTFDEPKANLRIYTTGSINITGATSEDGLIKCIQKVYPYLKEFSSPRSNNSKTTKLLDMEFFPTNKVRRGFKREQQQNLSKSELPNGFRNTKKARFREEITETGMYNNQMYFSDEDEELLDFEDFEEEYSEFDADIDDK